MKDLKKLSKAELIAEIIALREKQQVETEVANKNSGPEITLKEEKERFRTIINQAGDAMYLCNFEGEIKMTNNYSCEMLGYSRDEFLKMKIGDLDINYISPNLQKELWNTLVKDKPQTLLTTHKRKDGLLIPVEIRFSVIEFDGYKAILGFVRDITERKQAEQLIVKNKNRLEYALDKIETGAWELNLNTLEAWRSHKHDQIFGYNQPLKKWTFELFLEHVVLEDRDDVNQKFKAALATKTDWNFECRIKRNSDGKIRWIWANGNQEIDEDNHSGKMFGVVQDITEKKIAEDKILFQANLLDAVEQAVIVTNPTGKIIYWNPYAEKLYGWSSNETKGRMIGDITIPQTSKKQEEEITRMLLQGKSWSGEFDVQHRDRSTFPCFVTNTPIYNDNGKIVAIIGISTDISDRKNSEAELLKQKNMFELVINSVPSRIFWKDINSVYLGCNTSFLKAIEKNNVEDVIGKTDFDLIWGTEADKYINDDRAVIEAGTPKLGYDEDYCLPNGEKIWWQSSKMPLKDNTGEIIGILATSEDVTKRKKVEEELRKSELNYREQANFLNTITELSPFAMWVSDAKGLLIKANQALRELLNVSDEMIVGKYNVLQDGNLIDQGLMTTVEAIFTDLKKARFTMFWTGTKAGNIVLSHANPHWLDISMFPITDETGKLVNVVCQYLDVTEGKQAADLLKESEERFRALYDNAPLSYQSLNEEGGFKDINPTWLATLGYERDEIIGKSFGDFLHPDWQAHFEKNFPAFKKRGYVNDVQYKIRHKAGHYIDISFEGCVGYNPDGSFKQTYCVFQDITERKQAEEALQRNEEKLNLIINSSPIGICTADVLGNFITTNHAYEQILGYSKKELIGLSFFEVTHPDDRPKNKKLFQEMFSLNTADFAIEKRYLRKDGKEIIVSVHAVGIKDTSGKTKYGTAFIEDITDRKLAEENILKYQEQLEDLVQERTKNLEEKNRELERFNDLFVDREFRIKELREEIKRLK